MKQSVSGQALSQIFCSSGERRTPFQGLGQTRDLLNVC
jgi:hypothetical protein